jgi:hypothetical protein
MGGVVGVDRRGIMSDVEVREWGEEEGVTEALDFTPQGEAGLEANQQRKVRLERELLDLQLDNMELDIRVERDKLIQRRGPWAVISNYLFG